jgi:hypothetical protein
VRFLNDVCLRQMMLALPMMTASPNDAWLRHILWQTSHHCGTQWSNIILSDAKILFVFTSAWTPFITYHSGQEVYVSLSAVFLPCRGLKLGEGFDNAITIRSFF